MAAARRLFSFHLALRPREPARPLATAATAVAVPHRRGKHDAVACKATGKPKPKAGSKGGEQLRRRPLEEHLKRRTRSAAAFDADLYGHHGHAHHVPVLLGEVLAAFRRPRPLRSFVDCTLGAAGHSLAMMEAHPEMELYVGMDVDPTALEIGCGHIEAFLASRESNGGELCAYTVGNKPSAIVFAAGGRVCARVRAGVSSGPAVCARRDERNAIVCGDRRGVSGVKIGG
ncbi:hypothetical protein PVAP13_1KG042154 [Panicum virgatum]|uniref:Uncharacterized protein n=1 Tax=Panicum virgatum TaxID=38727 RepID=A0A8T0XKA3_PANVG|nr:hypothetical protein PVAP13_1KG042154 [Panicum virgatum]